jgi:hypothetical protein
VAGNIIPVNDDWISDEKVMIRMVLNESAKRGTNERERACGNGRS